MIDWCEQSGAGGSRNNLNTQLDRDTHFAVWIVIVDEIDWNRIEGLADVRGPMSDHDDDFFDCGFPEVADARFDYRPLAEWKQGLELAHTARTACSQNDGSDIVRGLCSWVFGL